MRQLTGMRYSHRTVATCVTINRRRIFLKWIGFIAGAFWMVAAPPITSAQLGNVENVNVTFLNGLTYEGKIAYVPKLGTTLEGMVTGDSGFPVLLIDDGLRRIYVANDPRDFQNIARSPSNYEDFEIKQPSRDQSGSALTQIGVIFNTGPFDAWGRRTVVVNRPRTGATPFTQAITLVTPKYCRLDIVNNGIPNTPRLEWSMNVATSSIPVDVLRQLLLRQINTDDFDQRLRVVEFFVQAERYRQARKELVAIAFDFPGMEKELMQQHELLLQAETAQSLSEIKGWLESGNPEIAFGMLEIVKQKRRLSSNILADINQLEKSFADDLESLERSRTLANQTIETVISKPDQDPEVTDLANGFAKEIESELNLYNRNRLASFERLESDATLSAEEKLALAVSGWILGNVAASESVPLAISLHNTRPLVERYLSPASPDERRQILQQLSEQEAGLPEYVSKIVANLLPPVQADLTAYRGPEPLAFTLEIPAAGGQQETCRYVIQLPPAYNPYRKYPLVVSLSGGTGRAESQIDWWAGEYRENLQMRRGFAARYGYIVMAPQWRRAGQGGYEFSASEHLRVLASLRHALRRFSIDTDRVFLSGHFDGGTAAWDIALAHPEHWAGVIPISARADKYINHYTDNAENNLPFYFVSGERDIVGRDQNATAWNRLLKKDYQTFVVEYQGRGVEDFHEELHDLYRWMNAYRRQPVQPEFECSTMRETDNYFWWLELRGIIAKKVVHPVEWDRVRRSDLKVAGRISDNKFTFRGLDDNATIWLSPDYVDFSQPIKVGSRFSTSVIPSTRVLLEDVRTRADRQHPWWARIDLIDKRWQVIEQTQPR